MLICDRKGEGDQWGRGVGNFLICVGKKGTPFDTVPLPVGQCKEPYRAIGVLILIFGSAD
jgi:hypothetical protein